MKPFTDGEFVKECLLTVVNILCPDKRDLFGKISLSARTVTRRIEDLSSDIWTTLQERAQHLNSMQLHLMRVLMRLILLRLQFS